MYTVCVWENRERVWTSPEFETIPQAMHLGKIEIDLGNTVELTEVETGRALKVWACGEVVESEID